MVLNGAYLGDDGRADEFAAELHGFQLEFGRARPGQPGAVEEALDRLREPFRLSPEDLGPLLDPW